MLVHMEGEGRCFVCGGERYTYVKYSVVKKEVGGQFSLYFSMWLL